MTTTFDIDEIERLLAGEETSGPWWNEGCEIFYLNDSGQRCTLIYDEGGHGEHDAALIVTLHNSAPAMIAELRELRAENARLRSVAGSFEIQGPDDDNLLWLIMRPSSALGGQAMFNLGGPSRIAGQCATILEQDRRAALGEPQ